MDKDYIILAELLSYSIRNTEVIQDNFTFTNDKTIDLNTLYKISQYHNVHTLLYNAIECLDDIYGATSLRELLESWGMQTAVQVKNDAENLKSVADIFHEFYSYHISSMTLNGLYIRALYPYPERRLLNDCQILVERNKYNECKKIILVAGYRVVRSSLSSAIFQNENGFTLYLINSDNNSSLIRNLWKRCEPSDILDMPILIPDAQEAFLYLIFDTANAIYSGDLKLSRLCDIALFIEKCGNSINWKRFKEDCTHYRLKSFAIHIIKASAKLLNVELPNELDNETFDNTVMSLLIDDILSTNKTAIKKPIAPSSQIKVSKLLGHIHATRRTDKQVVDSRRSLFQSLGL